MKRFLRRPSPAMIVAMTALFVSLGGVSYGVATGSIDSREIKNGSIRNRDFKDGTLRGNEAKRDGWGGGAIKESTLGKVKEAASTDTFGGMAARRLERFTLTNGQNRIVLTQGPFTLTANCRTEGANQVAEIVITTSVNDAAVDAAGKDTDLDVGQSAQMVAASAPVNTPAFDQEASGAAIATDGTELLGQELYAGTSVLGQPGVCRYGGTVYVG
jgi:hypothetical protein